MKPTDNSFNLAEKVTVAEAVTRSEFAEILSNSIPAEALAEINYIPNGSIPDVPMTSQSANAIYQLYRAGVLMGSDTKGNFNPTSSITRAESAVIIKRMAVTNLRKNITLTQ